MHFSLDLNRKRVYCRISRQFSVSWIQIWFAGISIEGFVSFVDNKNVIFFNVQKVCNIFTSLLPSGLTAKCVYTSGEQRWNCQNAVQEKLQHFLMVHQSVSPSAWGVATMRWVNGLILSHCEWCFDVNGPGCYSIWIQFWFYIRNSLIYCWWILKKKSVSSQN